jgi:DNA-binding transcriptional ArsR family regulator
MSQEEPDVARVAALLGEPARAAICLALCGGRPAAAGELAQRAGVSAQTASNHLAKLVGGRLVRVEAIGRNRFYRLANADVARLLEALLVVAPSPRPVHQAVHGEAFRFARTCYDHLAGRLGVELLGALRQRGWLRRLKG